MRTIIFNELKKQPVQLVVETDTSKGSILFFPLMLRYGDVDFLFGSRNKNQESFLPAGYSSMFTRFPCAGPRFQE